MPCILWIRVREFLENAASVCRVLNVRCDREDIQVQDKGKGTGAAKSFAIGPPASFAVPLPVPVPPRHPFPEYFNVLRTESLNTIQVVLFF
jgi:hypothetical protein